MNAVLRRFSAVSGVPIDVQAGRLAERPPGLVADRCPLYGRANSATIWPPGASRLMERLGPDTMLVLLSAPARVYSNDVDYEYRQDSNLYYLTGITQEDTALVLMPGNGTRREILFIKDRNPEREHWTGRLLSRDEARARTGIATVLSIASVRRRSSARCFEPASPTGRRSTRRRRRPSSMRSVTVEPGWRWPWNNPAPDEPPTRTQALLQKLRDRYVGYVPIDATPLLKTLRMVKTPYEMQMLTTATRHFGRGADGRHARGAPRRATNTR